MSNLIYAELDLPLELPPEELPLKVKEPRVIILEISPADDSEIQI